MKRAFKVVYFLGMLAEIVIRVPHERQRRQTRMVVDRVDWSERSLLGLMFVGMFFIPTVYTFTSRLDGADYRLLQEARGATGGAGTAVLAAAVWLFWRSHADLGRNWSPSLSYARDTRSLPKACTARSGTRCTLPCGCGA
jgi:hypothetical protein